MSGLSHTLNLESTKFKAAATPPGRVPVSVRALVSPLTANRLSVSRRIPAGKTRVGPGTGDKLGID